MRWQPHRTGRHCCCRWLWYLLLLLLLLHSRTNHSTGTALFHQHHCLLCHWVEGEISSQTERTGKVGTEYLKRWCSIRKEKIGEICIQSTKVVKENNKQ
uniref:Putative secreted peptide n=1 Tax=Anopheles braziliensis TaxID=58242 RepID=A0A2M3ZR45_9DIPT